MAANDMILVSTNTLEEIQTSLNQVRSRLDAYCGSVQSVLNGLTREAGAEVYVSLPGGRSSVSLRSGEIQDALESCRHALDSISKQSKRLSGAVGKSSALFEENERALLNRFNGENAGSASTQQGGGDDEGAADGGKEGSLMDWFRENIPGMAELLENLLSLGADGEKILTAIWAAIRAIFGSKLPAELYEFASMPLGELMKATVKEGFLGKLTGLDIAAFIGKVGLNLITDINTGLPTDRILCNAVANTLMATLSTVGGAVLGDLGATALAGVVGVVPGLQAAVPFVAAVSRPILRMVATYGIDTALGMEIDGKPVSEHIKDGIYNAYKGISEAIPHVQEAISTIGEYAQTGAEMIRDGMESVIDTASDMISDGVSAIQDGISNIQDGVSDFVDTIVSHPAVSWLGI